MADLHGILHPDHSIFDIVLTLMGVGNWQVWIQRLQLLVTSHDHDLWHVMTGVTMRPKDPCQSYGCTNGTTAPNSPIVGFKYEFHPRK